MSEEPKQVQEIEKESRELVLLALKDVRSLRRLFWGFLTFFCVFFSLAVIFMIMMGFFMFSGIRHVTDQIAEQERAFDKRWEASQRQFDQAQRGDRPSGWDKLEIGMTTEQVRQLLGKPMGVSTGFAGEEEWRYGMVSTVSFRNGKVTEYRSL